MKPPRFYLDTSIWSFAFTEDAPDYRADTEVFFDHVRVFGWEVLISQIVSDEIERAPNPLRENIQALIQKISPVVIPITEEVISLSREYIRAGVLSERHQNDCLHVAFATISECDFLLSWNFHHLANLHRASRFVAVNTLLGYTKRLVICNPLEVYEV